MVQIFRDLHIPCNLAALELGTVGEPSQQGFIWAQPTDWPNTILGPYISRPMRRIYMVSMGPRHFAT